jgi:hypothetical protein
MACCFERSKQELFYRNSKKTLAVKEYHAEVLEKYVRFQAIGKSSF